MLSIQLIRDDPDRIRQAVRDRNTTAPIDSILALDEQRRELIKRADELKAERNNLGRNLGQASAEERPALLERNRTISSEIDSLDEQLRRVDSELNAALLEVPNLPAADVPVAPDESGNIVRRTEGEAQRFDFEPKPHWEIGERLGIIDFERGVKLAGSRFYVLRGAGARLQRALVTYMLDLHTHQHGYTELYLPYVLREENLVRSGHLPKFRDTMYRDIDDDFWFIPTAEASIANYHGDEILEAAALPLRYVAWTACFRRERMSAGRDVRGIKRGHQFDKVELFRFCLPEESESHLAAMIGDAEDVLKGLGLHYRLLQLCTGDLDFKAAKSFDLEIWAPGCDEWLEVSSASNCTDFQARRGNIRYRPETAPGSTRAAPLEHPHMLNASGVALPRLLASVLETYQQADGSVVLPEALRPYFGADLVIRPPE
jgi:seryl-tRNA synthetase